MEPAKWVPPTYGQTAHRAFRPILMLNWSIAASSTNSQTEVIMANEGGAGLGCVAGGGVRAGAGCGWYDQAAGVPMRACSCLE
ncbi:hypothetical protein PILCRDRAFT_816305 [Piloderma croceum F 1598]|uniref:Uncharacterized protein n=1 Tax=Piloderma croceum (strain F 1598) TaxID=765440 RepID=A0A0C3FQH1_PILCF|nr:hypothetical protein PILCRDRAFT_816305 [Piloderma croceum F 1598]